MDTHSFTLRLNRAVRDDELDAVFEAGLDDAAVEGDLVHVDREAPTLLEAVWPAARQAAAVADDLHAVRVVWDDLVTLREIAQRAGRTYESARLFVEGRRGPGNFPAPEVDTQRGRVWSWVAVTDWLHSNGLATTDTGSWLARELQVADLLVQIAAVTAEVGPADRARISSVLREVA